MPYEKHAAPYRIQLAGKASKCTLCAHRVDIGKEPACVEGCPSKALIFGDLDDPKSPIRQRLWQSRQLLADLGTHPKVSYIAPKNDFRPSEQRSWRIGKPPGQDTTRLEQLYGGPGLE